MRFEDFVAYYEAQGFGEAEALCLAELALDAEGE